MPYEHYEAQAAAAARRRAVADQLAAQASRPMRNQVAPGGLVVPLGIADLAEQLGTAWMARRSGRKATEAEDKAKAEREAGLAEAVEQYRGAVPDAQVGATARDRIMAAPEGELAEPVIGRTEATNRLMDETMPRDQVAKMMVAQAMQPEEEYTLGPGEQRRRGSTVLASAPFKPDEPTAPESPFAKPSVGDFTSESVRAFEQGGGKDHSLLVPRPKEPDKADTDQALRNRLSTEEGLRKEFTSISKDFREMTNRAAAIEAAAKEPSAAGDLSIIFGYMKILDPQSSVREGEQATAQSAGSVGGQVWNMYNRVLTGERLTDAQRNDFINQARSLYTTRGAEQRALVKQYGEIAQRAGVDVNNVILGSFVPPAEQPQPRVQPPVVDPRTLSGYYDLTPEEQAELDKLLAQAGAAASATAANR